MTVDPPYAQQDRAPRFDQQETIWTRKRTQTDDGDAELSLRSFDKSTPLPSGWPMMRPWGHPKLVYQPFNSVLHPTVVCHAHAGSANAFCCQPHPPRLTCPHSTKSGHTRTQHPLSAAPRHPSSGIPPLSSTARPRPDLPLLSPPFGLLAHPVAAGIQMVLHTREPPL